MISTIPVVLSLTLLLSFVTAMQAEATKLLSVLTIPSNSVILTGSKYDVIFTTSTTATLGSIEITFPPGFIISGAVVISTTGIGSGNTSINGRELVYTINKTENIPRGTIIRMEIGNVINGGAGTNQIMVSIKDPKNNVIDGPTPSSVFTLNAIRRSMIYSGSITESLIAKSFMKFMRLTDGSAGWTPDDKQKRFTISDQAVNTTSILQISIDLPTGNAPGTVCGVDSVAPGIFGVSCTTPPANGAAINYAIINP